MASVTTKKTKKRILGVILVHTFGNLVNIDKKFIFECKKRYTKLLKMQPRVLAHTIKKIFQIHTQVALVILVAYLLMEIKL